MLTWLIATLTRLSRTLQQARRSGLLTLIVPFLLLIAVGTVVYALLERWTWLDALYATIITITTVGYGDIILEPNWRLLSGLTAANGFLCFGWSTAYMVELVRRTA